MHADPFCALFIYLFFTNDFLQRPPGMGILPGDLDQHNSLYDDETEGKGKRACCPQERLCIKRGVCSPQSSLTAFLLSFYM